MLHERPYIYQNQFKKEQKKKEKTYQVPGTCTSLLPNISINKKSLNNMKKAFSQSKDTTFSSNKNNKNVTLYNHNNLFLDQNTFYNYFHIFIIFSTTIIFNTTNATQQNNQQNTVTQHIQGIIDIHIFYRYLK